MTSQPLSYFPSFLIPSTHRTKLIQRLLPYLLFFLSLSLRIYLDRRKIFRNSRRLKTNRSIPRSFRDFQKIFLFSLSLFFQPRNAKECRERALLRPISDLNFDELLELGMCDFPCWLWSPGIPPLEILVEDRIGIRYKEPVYL